MSPIEYFACRRSLAEPRRRRRSLLKRPIAEPIEDRTTTRVADLESRALGLGVAFTLKHRRIFGLAIEVEERAGDVERRVAAWMIALRIVLPLSHARPAGSLASVSYAL